MWWCWETPLGIWAWHSGIALIREEGILTAEESHS